VLPSKRSDSSTDITSRKRSIFRDDVDESSLTSNDCIRILFDKDSGDELELDDLIDVNEDTFEDLQESDAESTSYRSQVCLDSEGNSVDAEDVGPASFQDTDDTSRGPTQRSDPADPIATIIVQYLFAFQASYRISDQALQSLLTFLSTIFDRLELEKHPFITSLVASSLDDIN
jgi:hypothetical protein